MIVLVLLDAILIRGDNKLFQRSPGHVFHDDLDAIGVIQVVQCKVLHDITMMELFWNPISYRD